MAWAQTATLEVSTNVTYPEYQYRIRNANNIWMASNTAPTQNNIASFAFFADGDDFYKIYSIDKGQWVSYDKSNGSDNCKDFVKFADSKDAANAWKITQATSNSYQIQPQNNNGEVTNRYWNWNAGVGNGGGYGYTYDDTKTVGLWKHNGSQDNGSAWILVDNNESVSEVADLENGAIYTFVTARGWMGANTTANVISSAYGDNNIPAADVKRTKLNFQWTVYKSANNKYYLYNIGKGQFMGMQTVSNEPIPFAKTPAGLKMTFKKSGNTNYPIMFSIDNVGVVNHSTDRKYGLIYWNGGWNNLADDGSNHKVVKVGELDDTTLSAIEASVAQYEETAILKMPEAGKYYRIKAVAEWNDDAPYLGSKNYTNSSRAEYVANADAYTIFYFDGNYLKSYATGHYLVSNSNFLGYNGEQATGSKIGFREDTNVAGVYNISFNDGNRWLYVHQNNYTDAGGSTSDSNGYRFNIEEVKQLPVAQSGNSVYYSLADARDNVKAGERLTLFVDTDEIIVLPLGVILDKNGHKADNVTVQQPAQIGEASYKTFDEAYTAAKNGDVIELFETAVISKTMANYNKKTITVEANGLETAFLVKSTVMMGTFAGMTIETDGTCITFGETAGDYNPTVDINGGTYKGGTSAIKVVSGLVRIADGVFSATENANTIVGDVKNVNVNGGKFYNFNPTSYIPNNRIAQQGTDGYWTVAEAAAKIGDVKYADLASAINAAQAGETVTLLRDINLGDLSSAVVVKKNITIDGEGYWTITVNSVNDSFNKAVFAPRGPISYTFKNLTVDLKNAASDMAAFNMKYGGTLENVTVKGAFGQAVSVTMAYPVTVTNCKFDGATWGVYASSSNVKVNVTGTTFNTAGAVYLHQYGEMVFTDNIVADYSYIETDATVDVSKNFWNGNNTTGAAPTATQLKGDNIICDTYYAANANGVLGDLTDNGVAEEPVIKIELNGETYEYGNSKLSLIAKLLGSSTQANAVKITLLDNVTLENGMQIAAYIQDGTLAITPKNVEINLNNKTLNGFVQINANVTATIKNGTIKAINNTYPGVDVAGKVTLDNVTINAENDVRVSSEAELIASAKVGKTYYTTLQAAINAVKAGDTFTLLAETSERIVLPMGVKLEKNGFNAPNVIETLPVAKVGETLYATFAEALSAAAAMNGDVTVEIFDKVTLNGPLTGSYTSIKFVGATTAARTAEPTAEIYLDVQGYITATGKKVAFEDLTLSKSQGGFINNAGFMNVAFGVYDVNEVTYTNCTFANGAYAAAGKVTYTGCTFKRSHDKYGLWAYGNVDVTVDDCTFADYRGIKMYAENGAAASVEKANLTVKNTNFSAVNDKPAIVLTYGESVTLENNTYSSTGTFELDLDGKPNGVAVTSDVAPTCKNDNGACGVLVDGKIYTTVAQAADVATSGSTVTLLHNSTETVVLPMGATLNTNGFEANGVTVAQPVAVIGEQKFTSLQAAIDAVQNGETIILQKDCAEAVTFTQTKEVSFVLDGNNKTYTGSINITARAGKDAPSTLVIKNFNFKTDAIAHDFIKSVETNYYPNNITISNCKFEGTADINTEDYAVVAVRLKSANNIKIENCTGSGLHSFLQNTAGWNMLIDNVDVTNSLSGFAMGTVQGAGIKNCDLTVNKSGIRFDAQYNNNAVIESNTIEAFIPVVVRKASVDSNIEVKGTNTLTATNTDGLWMAIGTSEYEDNGTMPTAATGKVRVTLNDANLSKAGIYGAYVPVAKIGNVEYTSLEAAFKAATEGCEIVILENVTVDYAWDARYTGGKFTVPVTINGNNHTIKFTASVNDNNNHAAFRFEADATVKNLTVDMSEATDSRFRAISSKGNLAVDGCTFIGKDATLNCRAIIFGEGAGTNVGNLAISVTNSKFSNWMRGITDNENGQDVKTATITGNTLENAAVYVSAKENVTFTGNTVEGAYVDIRSYTANNSLNVTAKENDLEANTDTAYNFIKNAGGTVVQEGFVLPAVAKSYDANGNKVANYSDFESAIAAAATDANIARIEVVSDFVQKSVANTSDYYDIKQNLVIAATEGKNYTVTGCGFAVRVQGATLTIANNLTVEGLDVVANGFSTSGDNMVIDGTVKALSLKQWTSNGTITVNGKVELGYGDGQFDMAYGNGAVVVNGNCNGEYTTAQFKAGYSGTRGNGGVLTLNNTYFEAGAWFTVGGSNTTINVNNSLLKVSGGDAAGSLTLAASNVINLDINSQIVTGSISGAGTINVNAEGVAAPVTIIKTNMSGFTGAINVEGGKYEITSEGLLVKPMALDGEGTEADPFLINNVEELLWFQANVDKQAADGSTQYAGKYIKMAADIDLAGINWNPIGSMSGDHASFKGVFDGDGHTISNLNVEQAGNGLGLFAYTSGNAVIKNLNLVNVTVKSTNNSNYVGGVVGNAYASTKIENVHVSGNVLISGRGYIGGIAGHGYVVMDNVSVVANEGGLITSTFWCAGGVLGYAGEGTTNIMNAHVEGLTITSAAGGLGAIVGMAEDNEGTQPISGSNLSAKNVEIKTYVGGYGTSYEDYALGYLYGGNETSKLTGTLSVENVTLTNASGNVPATIVDAVATDGDAVYFDFAAAVAAAADGKTIKLFKDVVVANAFAINGKEFTLDGNGKTISQAADCTNTYALFDINGGKVTIKNVTFDGVKGGAVVRTVGTEFAMDNVTAQNCEHTQQQGLFRLLGQNTITNSTFKNNNCSMVLTLNYDGASNTPQVVDNCQFEGNTVNGTAALYYVKGAGFTLKNSEFVRNTVNCNSNGATIYLGFTENNVVTGNLFQNNTVTDASTSTRVAGAIFFGHAANVSGNAFIGNTASNANGDVLGQVCTSTYYDCEIDLSSNYWGGDAPVYGKDYTIQHQTGEGTFALDSYYSDNALENLVEISYAAKVGKLGYASIKDAVAAVKEGETITILAGEHTEGTIKLPATLKNVTIKGAEGAILKNMKITSADGNSVNYEGLKFDGITFDNSNVVLTGWRNNGVVYKNIAVNGCTFKNLSAANTEAAFHINCGATEAVNGFTFTNNVIDNLTGGNKSGIYAQVTGEVKVENNVINNVQFRPYVIQVTTDDGIADNFIVTGNTFSGSKVGRAQGLGNNAEGTDAVNLVVSNNIFKGITDAQQICYWNFNAEKTTADLSKNYYDIDILANPGKIYYNSEAVSPFDLIAKKIFPIYTELKEDGTINTESAYSLNGGTWGGIDWTLTNDGTLTIAPTAGEPVPDKNAPTKRTYEVGEWRETVIYKSNGSASAVGGAPYDMNAVKKLIIKEGVTKIGSFTCQFPNLTGEVVIPSTVTYFGQEAFHKTPITKLTFAAGGTEPLCIANGVFKKTNIEEVSFPGDRPSIEIHHWAFGGSTKLKTAYIPANLTKVWGGEHVDYFDNFNSQTNVSWTNTGSIFTGCTAMETITFETEEIRDFFFAGNRQGTAEDPMVAAADLVAYNSLEKAIAAATDDIILCKSATLKDTWTIPAGKDMTLNLNGKTLSQSKACTASYEMINNKGNLTITGNGKLSFKDTGAGDASFGWGSYTVRNEGTLVVENGTIEHKGAQTSGTHCIMAIYQYCGSTTINGGTISTPNYRSVRLWKGDMTINGGKFEGQLWVQAVDNTANLVINGGEFAPRGNDGSSVFVTNNQYNVQLAVTGGKFATKIGCSDVSKLAGCISDGLFSEAAKENTNATLLATGYVFSEDADTEGYYAIVDDPATHYINNVEEFIAFRDAVNAGNDFAGVAVYLTADIDLAGIDWSVNIGDDCSATFDGTFDGQGYTIKNLTSIETAQKSDGYICTGLFGAIHGNAVLKNFTIENVNINTGDYTGNNVAAVVGFAYKVSGSIDNVKVTGDININAQNVTGVGAILGYDYYSPALTVKNCQVSGNNGSAIVGKSYTGGAVGYASTKIAINNNTIENVNVTATGSVAAVAGIMLGGSSATENIVKNVAVVATGELWANSAAVVAGTITGGTVTVANTTVENVTANGAAAALVGGQLVEKPTTAIAKVEAKIGNTYYATLDAALATEGEATVELLVPVTVAKDETRVINLNGKTITGVDTATGSYAMITNRGNLTIEGEGAITLTATINRGWNAYSSVISNTVGGKLTVNGGTIEHLGGTDMAYGIDNLTNGKGTYAETVINGGSVKSTYRAVRQFLNGVEAQNILTVNGGTIQGVNKSIWMQDPSANANTGTITVGENASLYGDVYLYVTAGSTEWPVSVSIAAAALKDGATVVTGNLPAECAVANVNGVWSNVAAAAAINGKGYATFAAAVEAAQKGETIVLLQDINEGIITIEKSLTIDGAGKTFTGHIHANLSNVKMTVKNVNFNGDNATYDYAIRVDRANSFVVENCTADGYKYSFLYANKSNNNFTIKDVTVTNCANYGVYFASFNNATIENLTVIGAEYGVAAGNAANSKVNIKNSTFDVELPLYIQNKGTGKVTFTFEGVNNMGDEIVYLSEYVKLASAAQVGTTVYGTFAEAFAAAQDGETVKLLSDFNLGLNDVVVNNEGQKVLANVDGKNITFDMNGKKITVNHTSTVKEERIFSVICVEDGAGLTVKGNGSIDVTTDVTDANVMPKVAYMFWKRGTTGYLVIEDGNYHMDNSEDSMVYTNGGNIVTVKGGTFILDAFGTRTNGFPWVFNVAGNNVANVNVTGGTYNYDIRTQFWAQEVKLAEGLTMTNNADGTWTVVPAVASIVGGESYGSIQEAIDAAQDGETVKLLADVAYADADALSVEEKPYSTMLYVQGKNITLDLNGKNIDVEYSGSLLYSVVLVSDGAGLTVTGEGSINVRGLKADGTAAKNIAYVFWKRGTTGYLVIENGTFRMNDAADSMVYTNGDEIVTVNGGTFILDAVASQSNGWPVIFNTAGNNEQQIVVNGGTFNYNINYQMRPFEVYIAPQKALKKVQVDGVDMWTIVAAQAYVTEKLGDFVTDENGSYEHNVGYATIAEAFAAVKNGETVTILAGEYTQNLNVNKAITVQGEVDAEGNNLVTFNGKLSIKADGATVENLNFNNSGTAAYVGAKNVTIDGCSLVGSNGLYQSYTSGTVTFKNSYIKGGTYGIHFDGNAGGNIVIENCTVIGWTSFAGTIENVAISGTTFDEGNYNQLRLYQNAQLTDCTFNEKMNIDWGSSNKTAEFTDCSVEGDKDLTEIISLANIATKGLEVTIDGELVCVAAKVGSKYYLSLQAAIDAATEGQTVTIVSDLTLTEGVTVAADDVIFIDLNGKTVSMETAEAAVAALIKNNGTLTIESSVDGGKLSFLATAPSAANAYASNTISNYGTLTIKGGTVENLSTGGACYALDNYAGSTATINGGKLTAEKTAVRIFNWTNGEANAAELNVVGGEIISNDGYGININAGNAPYVALNISGGTITTNDTDYNLAVYVINKNSAENFTANISGGTFNGNFALNGVTSTTMAKDKVSVSGGTFDGVICYDEPACQFITGGSYVTEFTEDYLVYGYQLEANAETNLYDANWTGRREKVTFIDGEFTEYTNENDIEVGKLTYKRSFSTAWTPLYVPFEIPVSELAADGLEVAYINGVRKSDYDEDGEFDNNGFNMELIMIHGGKGNADGAGKTLKANYPYFVRSKSGIANMEITLENVTLYAAEEKTYDCTTFLEKYEITGNCRKMTSDEFESNNYIVGADGWRNIRDGYPLNPFRFYMTVTSREDGSPIVGITFMSISVRGEELPDGTTIIYDVEAENNSEDMIFDLSGRRVLETEKGGIYIKNGEKFIAK